MKLRPLKLAFPAVLLLALLYAAPGPSQAAESNPDEYTRTEIKAGEARYIYEKPSRQKFSRLFWALGMLDLKDDKNIDNFLMMNECDIYKDYYYNEFEWRKVRESGRQFLAENSNKFPLRFEVAQMMLLGEYDLQTESFNVLPDYRISETSRIEVFPQDFADVVCQDDGSGRIQHIEGYPIGIIAEFNRPLNLVSIPVPEILARKYIEEKLKTFKKLRSDKQNQENLYSFRDAYLFMHMKFFAYKDQYTNNENYRMAEIMAVLEGFEIYADKDKKMLLWSQDFRKRRSKSKRATGNKVNLGAEEYEIEEPDPSVIQPSKPAEFNPTSPGSIAPQPGVTAPFLPEKEKPKPAQ
ncbi:MAG: DUF4852 domain-containing protein [Alphaproteobacteria bacterium]